MSWYKTQEKHIGQILFPPSIFLHWEELVKYRKIWIRSDYQAYHWKENEETDIPVTYYHHLK